MVPWSVGASETSAPGKGGAGKCGLVEPGSSAAEKPTLP
jgi:hypothetical protein